MNFKERCADCASLIEKNKKWVCEEVDDLCSNVVWCPYFADRY